MKIVKDVFTIVAILFFLQLSCGADEITDLSIYDVSSEIGSYGRYAVNIINNSGFKADIHSNLSRDMWQAADGDLTPFVVFDLNGLYDIDSLLIWNYNASDASYSTWFGARNIDIYVCTDRLISNDSIWTLVHSTILTKAPNPAAANYSSPDMVVFTAHEVAYVKLVIKKNYITDLGWTGSKWQQGNLSGLSEVKIFGDKQYSYSYIDNVSVIDYSDESLGWGFRAAENTINGSGFENGIHCMGWEVSWQAGPDNSPHYIVWDMRADSILDKIEVWNLNAANDEAWMASKNVDIYISNDRIDYFFLKSVTLRYPPLTNYYDDPDIIDCGRVEARYIKFVINSNYGINFKYVGLSEVRFKGYCFPDKPCEETLQSRLIADFSGSDGIADCYVDLYDFAYFSSIFMR